METIRTFIAIDTPEELKPEISALLEQLRATRADVRWEREDKFHITLKFLGDVRERMLPGILSQLQAALTEQPGFELTYSGLGCFPNMRYPKIVWVGAHNTDGRLASLHTTLEDELISFGFKREKNVFTPHITIGRVKSEHGIRDLVSTIEKLTLKPRTFFVNEVVIMKSVLKPSGSEYSVISTIALQQ